MLLHCWTKKCGNFHVFPNFDFFSNWSTKWGNCQALELIIHVRSRYRTKVWKFPRFSSCILLTYFSQLDISTDFLILVSQKCGNFHGFKMAMILLLHFQLVPKVWKFPRFFTLFCIIVKFDQEHGDFKTRSRTDHSCS